jgi:glutathione S-transferase
MADRALPLLWHLPISHFSEKVRWAFDWKRVPHRRRNAAPGLHPLVASVLTRGASITAPLLAVDGFVLGDSTDIVAWLEGESSFAPLYPASAELRERALAVEDWFDEHLGSAARMWVFYELCRSPPALEEVAEFQMSTLPGPKPPFAGALVRSFVRGRYGVGAAERAVEAREAIVRAFDRLEEELAGREFLAGDEFSIADLTAAALFYPIVQPPEGPWVLQAVPAPVAEFTASQADRPGWRWVEETWSRWRQRERTGEPAGSV